MSYCFALCQLVNTIRLTMRWTKAISLKVVTVMVFCGWLVGTTLGSALAESAPNPSLIISQLKITSSNGQFVTLYNATNTTLDMSKFQLAYFNSYDLSRSTSSRLIALSGNLPPHSYYMVNDSSLAICYQMSIDSMSLGFSSTAGMVQVVGINQSAVGGSVSSSVIDFVGWSKTAIAGAQTLPANLNAFLMRQPQDGLGNPSISIAGAGNWLAVQPDTKNPCQIVTNSPSPVAVNTGISQLLPTVGPTATMVNQVDDSTEQSLIPAQDIGLRSPVISELLPNPSGSGNDLTDEYIELFNPNNISFDLSGFALKTGIYTTRLYTFPSGTNLPPNSYTAFYSETTLLSLSNTGSIAKLLDPYGNSLSATTNYGTAKDGQAWALDNGTWRWTIKPTPGQANQVIIPISKSKKSSVKSITTKKSVQKTKAAKKPKSKKTKNIKLANASAEPEVKTSIQVWSIAIIACLTLLYACYEYRKDFSNKIFQLRRYIENRRGHRR